MRSFASLIESFGGPARFAESVGVTASHAGVMKTRDSIPPEYWPRVVAAAQARGVNGVSYEALALIAASKREGAAA